MLKKSLFVSMVLGLVTISSADDNLNSSSYAPASVVGRQMIMSYYEATGDLTSKLGETYYSDLKEHSFYSALLNGKQGHDGYYSYHRVNDNEAVITVEHPTGLYKGWTYDMILHFSNPHLGTFDITDQGMMNGTMRGVFTLN